MNYYDTFKRFFPEPVDFSEIEYEANEAEIDSAAQDTGYSFVGINNKRAVFSSK